MNDKYLTYNAVELAQDAAFIRWAKAGEARYAAQWEAWLARHPEKWQAVEEARLLVHALVIKEEPANPERIARIWGKIDAATGESAAQASPPGLKAWRWLGYAAAAALALLLAFFFLRPDGTAVLEAPYGQMAEHRLPDGSRVQLNAGSSIRYQENAWPGTRKLRLEGEAFFEVEKGKPFIVETPQGSVEVLGTSFNVNTFEGRFDVRCYTGRVQVTVDENQEILTAGQQALWAGNGWQRNNFEASAPPAWQSGRFEYHGTPLREVFAEMERQFDIRIDAPDSILSRTYTGAYERNALDSALYRVCWPMNLEASRQGDVVVVRAAGASPQPGSPGEGE
ncbi:MAG: FecR domain-containing protein [Phaeodactylibacter sp.]|nr:FecR domain-containing protein [Phaeodactylibacter sp.]MCB9298731.1 FecR domain-containing protein [Lewinellaceae bacterium]